MTTGTYMGPFGRAERLTIAPELNVGGGTLAWWLLTGGWHPLWPQFVLHVLSLKPAADLPEPVLHFPGATHELLVVALNPGTNPPRLHAPETLVSGGLAAVGGYLPPEDVAHQFEATDEEMVALAEACAKACVLGLLTPSTDDARTMLRERWLGSCVRTLAHMRGEVHAP
jgi:hypothetical protein